VGKLIVATDDKEIRELEGLLKQGKNNGVEDLKMLSKPDIKKLEPNIRAVSAIFSPSTGILDTHRLMVTLEAIAKDRGGTSAYNCKAKAIEKSKDGYTVKIEDADKSNTEVATPLLINAAGLQSHKVAGMAGIDIDGSGYKIHYSKGEYFRVRSSKSNSVTHLIYPVPKDTSLGIHTVTDLQGQLKVGPNAFYIDGIDYNVDSSHTLEFYEETKKFLDFLEPEDLSADMAGIRPKLQGPGEEVRDFVIRNEKEKGLPDFINLIGVESPGLTASLAIAKYLKGII
jgi:L-2-hydroxyglutarate oxidase LhgO